MPLWLRKFTFNKILESKQAESDATKKSSGNGKNTNIDLNNPDKSKIPNSQVKPPSYITKASKK